MKEGLSSANVLDVIGTDKVYRYRNKAQYPVCKTKNGVRAGFYATKTHNIIPISDCLIQNERFAPIVELVCRFAEEKNISVYDENTGKGLLRHIYLRSADMNSDGEIMLCLVINGTSLPFADELAARVKDSFPEVTSILLNINKKNTNVVLGEKYILLDGKGYIEDVLCGLRFKIAPEAFYQVNRDGAELLYTKAAELAELDGSSDVVDLYCGTGTIGLSMAKNSKRVFGIDIVEESIVCAKQNAKANGIENADFAATDAGVPENIKKCLDGAGIDISAATVVIDPPRKGSTPELIGFLAKENVQKVVYISCNPDTLARDCKLFLELGYTMSDVQPVNMFPRTGHVESVVCLTRRKI
jgi:23S rRNA (uracil1939-C5)-methyltransferase